MRGRSGARGARIPDFSEHALVAAVFDCGMEVEVGDAYGVPDRVPHDLHVTRIRGRQRRLVLLGPEQVDGMHGAVLLDEAGEVPVECWLGRLRPCDLDALPERLQSLLLPEH